MNTIFINLKSMRTSHFLPVSSSYGLGSRCQTHLKALTDGETNPPALYCIINTPKKGEKPGPKPGVSTVSRVETLVKERDLTLLNSIKFPVAKWVVHFSCNKCKNEHKTSYQSFLSTSGRGCPTCKITDLKSRTTGVARKSDEEKQQTAAAAATRRANPVRDVILHDRTALTEYLITHPNAYNDFLLPFVDQPLRQQGREDHHVIPRHAGGTDEPGNLISLTAREHVEAHRLRHEVYGEQNDARVVRMRQAETLTTEQIHLERVHASHEACRENQTGFFNSQQQSLNGQKGGKVITEKKIAKWQEKQNPLIVSALADGTKWSHPVLGVITVPPGKCKMVSDLQNHLINTLPEDEEKTKYLALTAEKPNHFCSNIRKIIVDKNRNRFGNFTIIRH